MYIASRADEFWDLIHVLHNRTPISCAISFKFYVSAPSFILWKEYIALDKLPEPCQKLWMNPDPVFMAFVGFNLSFSSLFLAFSKSWDTGPLLWYWVEVDNLWGSWHLAGLVYQYSWQREINIYFMFNNRDPCVCVHILSCPVICHH